MNTVFKYVMLTWRYFAQINVLFCNDKFFSERGKRENSMGQITELMTVLGSNIEFVVIGCAELAAAVALATTGIARKMKKEKKPDTKSAEQLFLYELGKSTDEGYMLVRRKDTMPVYAAGDLEQLLGVSLQQVQEDITLLRKKMKSDHAVKMLWKSYRTWDRKEPLYAEIQMENLQWIRVTVYDCKDEKHDLVCFIKTTGTHRRMEEYEKELEQAEEASQSKTSFLYQMSHEIRTPMNGIMGMLTLAKEKLDADHPAAQYLSKAEELSDHLLSLINDILDMSRIEAGKVELEEKSFSLRSLGDKLYDMFAKNLESRGIHYEVTFEDMSVDYVVGDELRISQIIINFLSNAVKFTQEGEIGVTFRQMFLQDGNVDLMIRVHDTGIGMNPEFINRIFRPFEQEGADTSRKYGGTGLGMAITDELVKLMNGEIVVKSVPGEGSDFSVFLHLPVAEEQEQRQQPDTGYEKEEPENADAEAFRGCRILMAEDNEINAMVAQEILGQMGAKVDVAENGQRAVEMFDSHPEGYYSFILMDVQMPVMNGRDAAKAIRKLPRKDAGEILIFALSADAFVEDERQSLESGMNGHYAKPVDFVALQQNIGAILREKERSNK